MPGPIIKGITLTKWLHAPGGREALNMRPLLIHKGLCCFSKLKFRRSFLVNQAAINIAKFSKTTALKRTNFSFNIFSQLQFQNHNRLVKPPGPLEHISHISFFCSQILFTLTREKNMLIATFLETKYKLTSVIL